MGDDITVTVSDDTNITITEGSQIKDTPIREIFTGLTGANQELALGNTFRANSLMGFLNGILMEKDVDYTEATARNKITVLNTLVAVDKIEVRYVID